MISLDFQEDKMFFKKAKKKQENSFKIWTEEDMIAEENKPGSLYGNVNFSWYTALYQRRINSHRKNGLQAVLFVLGSGLRASTLFIYGGGGETSYQN